MKLPERPVAVVTGAASGFGRAISLRLAARGARLLLSDVDETGLAETASLARATDPRAEVRTVRCDVREPEQLEAKAALADQVFGGTDLLVNNAGVAVAGRIGEVALDDWRWQVDINLYGVIHGCHAFVPRMRARRSGAILNVASAAGLISIPGAGPYNVTKAAVVALSETLYAELAGSGVSVTALCPTFFRTSIHANARTDNPRLAKLATKWVTGARWSAEEIADCALRGLEAGELYVIPQADGKIVWRAKRVLGQRFQDALKLINPGSVFDRLLG